ncbi:Ig-like domain repeat protein [Rhodococcus sp. ABRD24]|uniref:Ig-like domain-containing protein n=1 Tax=Rhodococcus sp. ABRD24 TaxID=2507582 RepID=UPI001040B421|nr:Ig-like domain-containing protein [Rhodococcus sp. ABRD24]QBJ96555.1 Ig-like domain repeat protein [Rhodococcus sp. ABRD24]
MATRVFRRLAAPFLVLVSASALVLAMAGPASADPSDPPPPSSSSGNQTADNLGWNTQIYSVNGVVGATNVLNPGDTVTYRSSIWENSRVGGFLNLGRYITTMWHLPPAGFQYVSSEVSMGATVTDVDGHIKAVCSGGGCSSVPVIGGGGFHIKGSTVLQYTVTYKVPDHPTPGDFDSGFLFDVYSFGSQQGVGATGAKVRVLHDHAETTTTVTAPTTVGKGSEANLTATVSPAGATGTVQFFEGANPIGDPVAVSGGTATLPHSFSEMGTYSISAKYTPSGQFHASESTAVPIEVGPVVTTTNVTVPATAEAGTTVPLAATISPAGADGTVQFAVNGTNVGNPVQVSDGMATLNHRFDDPGDFAVTANFTGGFGYANSAAAAQQVSVAYGAWQTTTVVVEPVTAESGSPTNLMASVRPIPTGGEVIFRVDGTEVGRADVGTADGVAVLEHIFATAGSYQVVAEFTGTDGFNASASTAFTAIVEDAPPVLTAVDADLKVEGLSVVGQTLTLTVTVGPADAVGTVQFYKGAEAIGVPVAVVNGKASITTTLDFEGTQLLSAKFLGGEGFRDTVSNPVVLNVSAAPETPNSGAGSLGSLLEGPLGGLLAGSIGG